MAVDVDFYYPFDAGPGANNAESHWRDLFRLMYGRLTERSGVRRQMLDQCEVFADSTGLWVKVRAGQVWIEGHYGQQESVKTVPVLPNATGSTRVDMVVARGNYTTNRVEFDVVAGTAVAPSRTQNSSVWELCLATINVINGATTIASTDVFDARDFLDNPSVIVRSTSDAVANNSTTLIDIPNMNIIGSSGAMYIFNAFIEYSSSSAADLKLRFTVPTGGSARVNSGAMDVSVTTNSFGIVDRMTWGSGQDFVATGIGTATRLVVPIRGWLVCPNSQSVAATPMTIKMQMAQNTANASATTVFANSWLELNRLA